MTIYFRTKKIVQVCNVVHNLLQNSACFVPLLFGHYKSISLELARKILPHVNIVNRNYPSVKVYVCLLQKGLFGSSELT